MKWCRSGREFRKRLLVTSPPYIASSFCASSLVKVWLEATQTLVECMDVFPFAVFELYLLFTLLGSAESKPE